MKITDILRTIANNLDHAQGGRPDPSIQNPAQLIDVVAAKGASDAEGRGPNGQTASGNDKEPPNLFIPPLQQKQELLKKAVGVDNIYDDGGPEYQHEEEKQQEIVQLKAQQQDIVNRIKQLSGVPVATIQELSNDDIVDD